MTAAAPARPDEPLRDHACGELRASHQGRAVRVAGWVHARRDHGGVYFFDLRDRSGRLQVVARPQDEQAFRAAEVLGAEHVVSVEGVVARRPAGSENPKLPTGEVELHARSIALLNPSKTPPFAVDDELHATEEVRLKYRFLDLRRPRMLRNLALRHRAAMAARARLDSLGFWEVETPILTKSTPEGARDFLVPSRLNPGQFYALPQSPQIFKQILQASGVERYFQFARAFRDEDLRADRQPEHTQIDLEMSFVRERDVHEVVEGMLAAVFKATLGLDLALPFEGLDYAEVLARFGSDKPDLRFGLELRDCTELFRGSAFKVFGEAVAAGGAVRALPASADRPLNRAELDKLGDLAKSLGAKGLAWLRWKGAAGGLKADGPIVKFMSAAELDGLKRLVDPKPEDVLLFAAGPGEEASKLLGALRKELIPRLGLKPAQPWRFLWVKHFPLLEPDAESGHWTFTHNPFTAPLAGELSKLDTDPGHVRSHQYDLVLNGVELASGSIRNHRSDVQEKILGLMGYGPEERRQRFGLLLNALDYGAPPHGGIAVGFDRLCALLCGEESIREVIAFPKTAKGLDLMSEAPGPVGERQLKELHIRLDA